MGSWAAVSRSQVTPASSSSEERESARDALHEVLNGGLGVGAAHGLERDLSREARVLRAGAARGALQHGDVAVLVAQALVEAERVRVVVPDHQVELRHAPVPEPRLGRAHHRVVHFVTRYPGLKVADLLDVLRITKQSLSRVLSELLRKGKKHTYRCPVRQ